MSKELMKQQWDDMARLNPFFSITSWPEFERLESLDQARFWETGRVHAKNLLRRLRLGDTRKLRMVEIGCGMGRMTHTFAERFAHVLALDISPEMVSRARQFWGHLENVTFVEGGGTDLAPIADASVDFVFSFYVLGHITDPQVILNYLTETGRVLRRSGQALLHFRVKPDPELEHRSLIERLRESWRDHRPGFWWNRGIVRSGTAYATDLPTQFGERESWRGCEVAWPDVKRVIRGAGLRISGTDLAVTPDTRFLFLYLRKHAA